MLSIIIDPNPFFSSRRRRRVKFIIDTDDEAPTAFKGDKGPKASKQRQSWRNLAPVPFTAVPSSSDPSAEFDPESLSRPLMAPTMSQASKPASLKTITHRYADGDDNISLGDSEHTRTSSPESSVVPPSRLWQFDTVLPTIEDTTTLHSHRSSTTRFVEDQEGQNYA